jgi:hypothetical protein
LRLMSGRMKILLWAIIATINISMGLNAVFMWTRCTPSWKTWNPSSPGTCWAPHVYPNYGMFAAGELSPHQVKCLSDVSSAQVTLLLWTLF